MMRINLNQAPLTKRSNDFKLLKTRRNNEEKLKIGSVETKLNSSVQLFSLTQSKNGMSGKRSLLKPTNNSIFVP
jgi:hypothetical protein